MNRGGSRLRFSCVLRIALSGLWVRPVRLILTIALSLMAFVLTGCAVTLALYDEDTARAETYAQLTDVFLLTRSDGARFGQGEPDWALALPRGEVAQAGRAICEISVPDEAAEAWGNRIYNYSSAHNVHIQLAVNGVSCLSDEVWSALGGSWLAGGAPQADDEAAISSCLGHAYLAGGIYEAGTFREADGMEDLIGLRLSIGLPDGTRHTFAASGVYDCSGCPQTMSGQHGACSGDDRTDWRGTFFVTESTFDLVASSLGGADGVWFAGDHDRATGAALVAFLEENPLYQSSLFLPIVQYGEDIATLIGWVGSFGAVLVIFSALLFYQLIAILLDDKRQTIGVLRMLGARARICILLALTESLVFGVAVGIAAAGISVACVPLLNILLASLFHVRVALAGYHILAPLCVFLLSVIVAGLAAILPSLRMMQKSPIELWRSLTQ